MSLNILLSPILGSDTLLPARGRKLIDNIFEVVQILKFRHLIPCKGPKRHKP